MCRVHVHLQERLGSDSGGFYVSHVRYVILRHCGVLHQSLPRNESRAWRLLRLEWISRFVWSGRLTAPNCNYNRKAVTRQFFSSSYAALKYTILQAHLRDLLSSQLPTELQLPKPIQAHQSWPSSRCSSSVCGGCSSCSPSSNSASQATVRRDPASPRALVLTSRSRILWPQPLSVCPQTRVIAPHLHSVTKPCLNSLTPPFLASLLLRSHPLTSPPHSHRDSFLVFVSIWTILVVLFLALAPRFVSSIAHPFALLALDLLTTLFWFAGFIALAVYDHNLHDVGFGDIYNGDVYGACSVLGNYCGLITAAVVFGAFEW